LILATGEGIFAIAKSNLNLVSSLTVTGVVSFGLSEVTFSAISSDGLSPHAVKIMDKEILVATNNLFI
jgi:hypothetical protein